ncbi:hypothetical protein QTI51_04005 [Variovorax sp. J22G73]|uniref:hypothetical protein n=1 Tax=unclassified Variovorax TaxID=663243 RepID=UPI002574F0AF|nr:MULTISPECIES: hypothetical protein [unclassified Variovorax]MDM0003908.1 hypothetical protein [Variovorax sp. J22R203]MDM0096426.1 hypothetical protein [Variovorax sp. J22G73]
MKLSADKKKLQLQIEGEFDAAGVEQLIRDLAELRRDMQPGVPATWEAAFQADCGVEQEDKPGVSVGQRLDGTFRLAMRHRGLGWLSFQLDQRTASALAEFIAQRSARTEAGNLAADEGGRAH